MQKFFAKVPFLRIFLPFLSGVISEEYLHSSYFIKLVILFFLLGVYIIIHALTLHRADRGKDFYYGLVLTLLLFFCGYFRSFLYNQIPPDHVSEFAGKSVFISGAIGDEPVKQSNKWRVVFNAHELIVNGRTSNVSGKVLINVRTNSGSAVYSYGENLVIEGILQPVPAPAFTQTFDYRKYLSRMKIHSVMYLKEDKILRCGGKKDIWEHIFLFKKKIRGILQGWTVSPEVLGVAESLLLGYREDLPEDLRNDYAGTGTIHVLAVSGLHVGIICWIVFYILFPLDFFPGGRVLRGVITLAVIFFYALLTGLSPSVSRAAVMFGILLIGKMQRSYTNIYNTLCVSAFALLLINPNFLYSAGFQLSYCAVAGIVWLQPKIYKLVSFHSKFRFLNNSGDKIWMMTSVTLAAQIFTAPVSIYYFNQFPVYFLPANLIVIPCSTIALGSGILAAATHLFSPSFSDILSVVPVFFIQCMTATIRFISRIPGSAVYAIPFSFMMLILSSGMFFLIIEFCTTKKKIFFYLFSVFLLSGVCYSWISRLFSDEKFMGVYFRGRQVFCYLRPYRSAWLITEKNKTDEISKQEKYFRSFLQKNGISGFSRVVLLRHSEITPMPLYPVHCPAYKKKSFRSGIRLKFAFTQAGERMYVFGGSGNVFHVIKCRNNHKKNNLSVQGTCAMLTRNNFFQMDL